MFLRAAKTEAEDAGESTDGMAESVSELRDEILALTGGKVDIQIDDDTFKSTYQILRELSSVWEDLTDVSKANILELVGGKRNSNVVAALLENFSVAEEALKTSATSAGSAVAENEKVLESIQGKLNVLKATFQEISLSFVSSDFISGAITGLTKLLEILNSFVGVVGPLPTAIGAITLALSALGKKAGAFSLGGTRGDQFQIFSKSIQQVKDDFKALEPAGRGVSIQSIFSSSDTNQKLIALQKFNEAISNGGSKVAAYKKYIADLPIEFRKMSVQIAKGETTVGDCAKKLELMGVKSKAAAVGVAALNVATNMLITMGVTAAITGIIAGLDALINRQEKAAEKAKEIAQDSRDAAQKQSEQTESISSLTNKYEELASGDTQNSSTREEILSIQDQLTALVGDEAGNIDLVNGKLSEQLAILQEIHDIELGQSVSDYRKAYIDSANSAKKQVYHKGNFWADMWSGIINGDNDNNTITFDFWGEDTKREKGLKLINDRWKEKGYGRAFVDVLKSPDSLMLDSYSKLEFEKGMSLEQKKKAIDEAIQVLENNKDIDYTDTKLWGKLVDVRSELFGKDSEYTKQIQTASSFLSKLTESKIKSGEDVGTYEDYMSYRQKLIDEITNDTTIAQAIQDGVISNDQISTSVDGYLATLEKYDDYYSKWQASIQNKVAEGAESVKKSFADSLSPNGNNESVISEFNNWIDGLSDSDKEIVYDISLDKDTAEWGLDNWKSELQSLKSDTTSLDLLKAKVQAVKDVASGTINLDISTEASGIEQLQSALKSSVSGTGLTKDLINSTKNRYSNLAGFNSAELFEKTANGIHLNVDALRELESEYEAVKSAYLNSSLDERVRKYNELTEKISACTDAQEKSKLIAEQNSLSTKIEETATLAAQYDGLTSAYQKWIDAQSGGEEGDMYDALASKLESIKELYDKGLVGTNEFRAAAQLMTNFDISDWGIDEVTRAFENGYPLMTRYFTDGQEGCQRFLSDVSELNSEWAHMNQDGSWEIDFGSGNDQAVADKLGISVEAVQAIMRKLSDYGFNINLDSVFSDIELLEDKCTAASDKLNELGATDVSFNVNSNNISDVENQIEEATALLENFKNSDGSINMSVPGAEETVTILSALIQRKQELEEPAIMNVDTFNASSEVELLIQLLQKFTQSFNELEIDAALGIDTTESQAEIDSAVSTIQNAAPEILASLGVDPTSAETIKTSIQSITPSMMVEAGIDETLINSFKNEEHTASGKLKWTNDPSLVDAYISQPHTATGIVKWSNNMQDVKTRFLADGYINWANGMNGKAGARGTAFSNGNWGARKAGIALGGELGQELVVRDGRFFTIGDDGAEFFAYKKDDIIFNADQTRQIFEKGKISSGNRRGRALAEGTAFSSGSGKFFQSGKVQTTATTTTNKANTKTTTDTNKTNVKTYKASETVDVSANVKVSDVKVDDESLEDALKDMQEEIDDIIGDYEHQIFLAEKHKALDSEIIAIYTQMQQKVHDQTEAYRAKGLDENSEYIQKMQKQWWEYQESIDDIIAEGYEDNRQQLENAIDLATLQMEKAVASRNYSAVSDYTDNIIEYYKQMQESVRDQAEYYRKLGYDDTSDEVSELSKLWWDYQENISDVIAEGYENYRQQLENAADLAATRMENAVTSRNYSAVSDYTDNIIGYYKQMQESVHDQAEYYRKLGYDDTSDEVSELSKLWWDYQENISDAISNGYDALVEKAKESIETIQEVYDTLKSAAEEYSETGKLPVDLLTSMSEIGIEYMSYLKDESGMLSINKKAIDSVIAARTNQLAVDTALSYVEKLRLALADDNTAEVNKLVSATENASNATWGLVYANLALLDLEDSQYKKVLSNINKFRSLANNAANGVYAEAGKKRSEILDETKDALDTILDLTEDLIEYEVNQEIDALEDQKDEYREIIELKKEALETTKEEDDYNKKVAKKIAEIAKIQSQINKLSLDDSREAQAEKASLEEELAELQTDLSDYQADYSLDKQTEMLDDMADAYDDEKDEEIQTLKDSISSTEKIYQLAIERIKDDWDGLYYDIIDWNYEAGSSIESDIVAAWKLASEAVNEYGSYVRAVKKITAAEDDSDDALDLGESTQYGDPNSIISKMRSNSLNWLISDSNTQRYLSKQNASYAKQLSAIYGQQVESKNGSWYIEGTSDPLYSLGTWEAVDYIAKAMRNNSAKWSSASDAEKSLLESANERMAGYIQELSGRKVRKDENGVWWIGSDNLYESYGRYHSGGVIGDPTLKQNEVMAILKDGELVIDENREKGLYKLVDFAQLLSERLGTTIDTDRLNSLFNGFSGLSVFPASNELLHTTKADPRLMSFSPSIEVNISHNGSMSDNDAKRYGSAIAETALGELKNAFTKKGFTNIGNSALK